MERKGRETSYKTKLFSRTEILPSDSSRSAINKFQMNTSVGNSEPSQADLLTLYHPSGLWGHKELDTTE